MSKMVESLVWERSRAGKSNLLMLVKIADLCPTDDGFDCFAEPPYLAKCCRTTERGAQYILQRLQEAGEIDIEYNDAGREVKLRGGRMFRPKWFIQVRCVSAWDAYQRGEKSEKFAGLRRGRPRRKPAKIADFIGPEMRKIRQGNAKKPVEKCERTDNAYKERSVLDPCIEQEQGQAGASGPLFPDSELTLDDYLRVVTKVAHEVLDDYPHASDDALAELLKARIGVLNRGHAERSKIQYDADLIRRAIDSARWQRRNPRSA